MSCPACNGVSDIKQTDWCLICLQSLNAKCILCQVSTNSCTQITCTQITISRNCMHAYHTCCMKSWIKNGYIKVGEKKWDIQNKIDNNIRYTSKLSKTLECSICRHVLQDPVSGVCGHVCCRECMIMWKQCKTNPNCPQCRTPLGEKLVPHYRLNTIIHGLLARCPDNSCTFTCRNKKKMHQHYIDQHIDNGSTTL